MACHIVPEREVRECYMISVLITGINWRFQWSREKVSDARSNQERRCALHLSCFTSRSIHNHPSARDTMVVQNSAAGRMWSASVVNSGLIFHIIINYIRTRKKHLAYPPNCNLWGGLVMPLPVTLVPGYQHLNSCMDIYILLRTNSKSRVQQHMEYPFEANFSCCNVLGEKWNL